MSAISPPPMKIRLTSNTPQPKYSCITMGIMVWKKTNINKLAQLSAHAQLDNLPPLRCHRSKGWKLLTGAVQMCPWGILDHKKPFTCFAWLIRDDLKIAPQHLQLLTFYVDGERCPAIAFFLACQAPVKRTFSHRYTALAPHLRLLSISLHFLKFSCEVVKHGKGCDQEQKKNDPQECPRCIQWIDFQYAQNAEMAVAEQELEGRRGKDTYLFCSVANRQDWCSLLNFSHTTNLGSHCWLCCRPYACNLKKNLTSRFAKFHFYNTIKAMICMWFHTA